MKTSYVDLLSKRSYINYLFQYENKHIINNSINANTIYRKQKQIIKDSMASFTVWHNMRVGSNQLAVDPYLIRDSELKNFNHEQRIRAVVLEKLNINSMYDISKAKSDISPNSNYHKLDFWLLALKVTQGDEVTYEDFCLSHGASGNLYNLHDDDFIYFSEVLNQMFEKYYKFA
jgi:hypothetical protein